MTPQEQQASDVMHRELGVKQCEPLKKVILGADGGEMIIAVHHHGEIYLEHGSMVIPLDKSAFKTLELFAEHIGWRCE